MIRIVVALLLLSVSYASCAQVPGDIKDRYTKLERMIPMRDGVQLFTAIYIPKAVSGKMPLLMQRTPYSCNPYGETAYPRRLGPGALFAAENYIYVYQDVRGRYMSEGTFEEVTPHIANKKSIKDTDESSDTYDTVEWLLKNIENNNGNVGIFGISYPGFYATAALPNAHPAIKAVSPQAPVTDEFEGDDAYHGGAFFLMDNFSFMNQFDYPRTQPWKQYPSIFDVTMTDAYDFYLKLGPLKNANEKYYLNKSKIWNEYIAHHTKDAYWQSRDIRIHLKNIKPAVLVVGGWYDAEDLFGALNTYATIEKNSPGNKNTLVMGPWTHGSWSRPEWSKFASLSFGSNTSAYYQKLEFDFFNYYLKAKGDYKPTEATVFETGTNQWKQYTAWPPPNAAVTNWYLGSEKLLSLTKPKQLSGEDEYTSDPASPVPYMDTKRGGRNNEYMVADQSFASKRSDVLTYTSTQLTENVTLSGPIVANLFVTNSGTDADFIIKVIDILPDTATDDAGKSIGGMQRLVRAEVLRGKFRNSFTMPSAFEPGKVANVKVRLNDVAHSFLKGHKIMIQVQSSWFPLVDRNPQQFLNIFEANESDFKKATIKVLHSEKYPSSIQVLQSR